MSRLSRTADGAEARNIELVTMSTAFFNQQKDRISELIKSDGKECNVTDERERRKEEKRKPMEDGKRAVEESNFKRFCE